MVDVNENLSHKMTVQAAVKPEIKFWPKRTLVLILSVLATFFGTAIVLVILELFKPKKLAVVEEELD